MNLGVAMLPRLGGRELNNLARAVVNENVSALSKCRALHRSRQRRARRNAFELKVVLLFIVATVVSHLRTSDGRGDGAGEWVRFGVGTEARDG